MSTLNDTAYRLQQQQQQYTGPKKNPYLTQFKNGTSNKQRQIRETLAGSFKSLNLDSQNNIPSIDDDVEDTDFRLRYREKLNYFDDVAPPFSELSGTEDTKSPSPQKSPKSKEPKSIVTSKQSGYSRSYYELSSTRNRNSPIAYKSSDLDELPPQPKLNYHKQDYLANIQGLKTVSNPASTADKKPKRYVVTEGLDIEPPIPFNTTKTVRQKTNDRLQEPEPIYYQKNIITHQTSESKVDDAQSNYFSRARSNNNSLLKAHDSMRLKSGKKVRSKYNGPAPNETELDVVLSSSHTSLPLKNIDLPMKTKSKLKEHKSRSKEFKQSSANDTDIIVSSPEFAEIRDITVELDKDDSVGVTVRVENDKIVVARVLTGGAADKQKSLRVGDIILAVNGREISTPEQLQHQLRKIAMNRSVRFKIVPSYREDKPSLCVYMRALFNYVASNDSLIPCQEAGVSFNQGDILEVVNQEDPNWWQARRVDCEEMTTGLIPSQELEERRQAFVIPDYDLATKTSICGTRVSRVSRKKEIYAVSQNSDFDKAALPLYEEVCRTPAFERRTLVLVGANGVGRQALKAKLIAESPDKFSTPLPHTSRAMRDGEEDGVHYHFDTIEQMEEDIFSGRYLEFGEYEGALYGTKLDSVREIIASGRICVLDCNATCLKLLKTSDYLPFVVFIGAPTLDQLRYIHEWAGGKTYATLDRAMSRQSRRGQTLQDFAFEFFEDEDLQLTIEESGRLFRVYENYFDLVLVNENLDVSTLR